MANIALSYRRIEELEHAAYVELTGTLDAATIVTFEGSLLRLRTEGYNKFVLGMAGVEYMSSTGVGALIKLNDGLRVQSGGLVLSGLQPQVLLSFNLLGLGSVLPVFESAADSVQAMVEQFETGPDGGSADGSAASSILRGFDANPTDVSVYDGIFARIAMKLEMCTVAQVAQAVMTLGEFRGKREEKPTLPAALVEAGALTQAQVDEVRARQRTARLVCPRCNKAADTTSSWSEGSLCADCQVPLRIDLDEMPYDPRAIAEQLADQDTVSWDAKEYEDVPVGVRPSSGLHTPDDSWVRSMLEGPEAEAIRAAREGLPRPASELGLPPAKVPGGVPAPPASRRSFVDERMVLIMIVIAVLAGVVGWLLRSFGS